MARLCEDCDVAFRRSTDYKKHRRRFHSSYRCSLCHKVFAKLVALKSHKLRCRRGHKNAGNGGLESAVFDICRRGGMSILTEKQLNKQFDSYLTKKFAGSSNVAVNEKRCKFCFKCFKLASEFSSHIRDHYEFNATDVTVVKNKHDFMNLMGLETKERIVEVRNDNGKKTTTPVMKECSVVIIGAKCAICHKSFKCKADVEVHIRTKHPVNYCSDDVDVREQLIGRSCKFTTLVLKIGDEIVSRKTLKKRHLRIGFEERMSSREKKRQRIDENETEVGKDLASHESKSKAKEVTRHEIEEISHRISANEYYGENNAEAMCLRSDERSDDSSPDVYADDRSYESLIEEEINRIECNAKDLTKRNLNAKNVEACSEENHNICCVEEEINEENDYFVEEAEGLSGEISMEKNNNTYCVEEGNHEEYDYCVGRMKRADEPVKAIASEENNNTCCVEGNSEEYRYCMDRMAEVEGPLEAPATEYEENPELGEEYWLAKIKEDKKLDRAVATLHEKMCNLHDTESSVRTDPKSTTEDQREDEGSRLVDSDTSSEAICSISPNRQRRAISIEDDIHEVITIEDHDSEQQFQEQSIDVYEEETSYAYKVHDTSYEDDMDDIYEVTSAYNDDIREHNDMMCRQDEYLAVGTDVTNGKAFIRNEDKWYQDSLVKEEVMLEDCTFYQKEVVNIYYI